MKTLNFLRNQTFCEIIFPCIINFLLINFYTKKVWITVEISISNSMIGLSTLSCQAGYTKRQREKEEEDSHLSLIMLAKKKMMKRGC